MEESAPAMEESAPAMEESAPAMEESAPAMEESAPAMEESTPAMEESTPAMEESAPAMEESTPAMVEPTQTVEESTQTSSSANVEHVNGNEAEDIIMDGDDEIVVLNDLPGYTANRMTVATTPTTTPNEFTVKSIEIVTCSVCCGIFYNAMTVTPCGHVFCAGCIAKWYMMKGTCPECRGVCRDIVENWSIRKIAEQFLEQFPEHNRQEREKIAMDKSERCYLLRFIKKWTPITLMEWEKYAIIPNNNEVIAMCQSHSMNQMRRKALRIETIERERRIGGRTTNELIRRLDDFEENHPPQNMENSEGFPFEVRADDFDDDSDDDFDDDDDPAEDFQQDSRQHYQQNSQEAQAHYPPFGYHHQHGEQFHHAHHHTHPWALSSVVYPVNNVVVGVPTHVPGIHVMPMMTGPQPSQNMMNQGRHMEPIVDFTTNRRSAPRNGVNRGRRAEPIVDFTTNRRNAPPRNLTNRGIQVEPIVDFTTNRRAERNVAANAQPMRNLRRSQRIFNRTLS